MATLFGSSQLATMDAVANSNEVLEMFFVDDILKGNSEQIHEFCESEEAKILQEKSILKKPTLMRLSKADDEKRRVKLMAYQLAKEAGDPNWTKLKSFTSKRKDCIEKIMAKYGPKAEKMAKIAQKNYIAIASKVSASAKKS